MNYKSEEKSIVRTKELNGRVAMVTGGAGGLGRVIAINLAGLGARVAVNDLPSREKAVRTVIDEINRGGGDAISALADITSVAPVNLFFKLIMEKWGRLDILVNNAGVIGDGKPLVQTSDEAWDIVLDTNLRGAFLVTRAVLGQMIKQHHGRVITIVSVAGIVGRANRVSYSTSKGGLIAFTRSLAREVGINNITVNAIAPGLIETGLTANLPEESRSVVLSHTAIKRLGTPQDVADLVLFLASDRASYITGQVIPLDGGEI